MNRFFLGILSAALAIAVVPLPIKAAGFTITPMLQEVTLGDGQDTLVYETSVSNETDAIATLEVSVVDFGSLDESGGAAFIGATGELEQKYALASWMQPEVSEITLASGETRSIRVRIENRENLSPGGHYGALIFKNRGTTNSDVPSVAINQIFASLVLVKKTGGAVYGIELASVEHAENWFSFNPTVRLRFRNSGNVHIAPRGEIRVTDPLGRLVYRGIVNEGSAIALPETFREYPLKLFPVEKAFVPGYYSLDLSYRYDGREAFETWSKRQFFIPPFVIVPVVLVVIGAALFLWRRRASRRIQHP